MATAALVLLVVFGVLTLGVRVAVQLRRTGTTGLVGIDRSAGPAGWAGGLLFLVGMAAGINGPFQALTGAVPPLESLDTTPLHLLGVGLGVAGGLGVFGAQMAMGASWRIGVDEQERTELVTDGIFAICRNPVYTAMVIAWTGLALMVPSPLSIAAPVLVAIGLQLQVRAIEEPYLLRLHGGAYRAYASRVGRFLPGIGRSSWASGR